ncbi:hypothetical protein LIER_15289 [Lithospermum erythrorhizon]|uniref:LOB domain-containing protein n=1 Tax=Lithospermum erythrorhizon TaxID=34254 RepID=A0AAV3Q479_LITER
MAQENNNSGDGNSRKGDEIGNIPPCPACKHHRRKCIRGQCILWSFFRESEAKEFKAVQKLFGTSTVTRIIREQDSIEKRTRAAKSLKYEAMMWQKYPDSGPCRMISGLIQENEMLRGFIQQHLHQFQGNPLPFNHLNVPVNPHMFASSSSSAEVGNSQQNWVLSNGNYVPVFQNNGQMGFDENGVLQRPVIMENQEISRSHGLEGYNGTNANFGVGGYNGNNSNVGVGGLDGYSNVQGYEWRTAEMEGTRIGSRNIIHGVEQIRGISGTQLLSPHQGGYGDNDGSVNVRGYDSSIVGMEAAGMNANNIVYGQSGEDGVEQTGTSSRSEQSTQQET